VQQLSGNSAGTTSPSLQALVTHTGVVQTSNGETILCFSLPLPSDPAKPASTFSQSAATGGPAAGTTAPLTGHRRMVLSASSHNNHHPRQLYATSLGVLADSAMTDLQQELASQPGAVGDDGQSLPSQGTRAGEGGVGMGSIHPAVVARRQLQGSASTWIATSRDQCRWLKNTLQCSHNHSATAALLCYHVIDLCNSS
jgi:hypothetical protein